MKIIRETDPRFVNIEKKIGMFVIIAIIGIIAGATFIGIQQEVFIPKTRIYFIAESGQGLNEGMAVKLSGFKIGKIEKLSLDDIARVKVDLSINTKYMRWIKTDSKARLIKEGLIGESIIEITPGSLNAKQIAEKDMITFEREKGIGEMAEGLKDEIKPLVTDIRQIIHYINDPQGDVKQTLQNLKKLSVDLSTTRQHLDTLLKDTNKNITSTASGIDSLVRSAKQTVNIVDNAINKIDKDIPHLMEKIDKSLDNVQKTTEELKKTAEQSAVKVSPILEKGNELTEDAKEVVNSIKQVWPIRLFIETPEEKTLKMDSYDSK